VKTIRGLKACDLESWWNQCHNELIPCSAGSLYILRPDRKDNFVFQKRWSNSWSQQRNTVETDKNTNQKSKTEVRTKVPDDPWRFLLRLRVAFVLFGPFGPFGFAESSIRQFGCVDAFRTSNGFCVDLFYQHWLASGLIVLSDALAKVPPWFSSGRHMAWVCDGFVMGLWWVCVRSFTSMGAC
jgi:hypothetical protein